MRWNTYIGLSDQAFMIGDEIIAPLISRLNTMPVFILAAHLCPPGVEATLFALSMGLSNYGGAIGSYLGIGLVEIVGVSSPEFEGLPMLVLIKVGDCFLFSMYSINSDKNIYLSFKYT